MITIRLNILYAGNFVVMSLESLVALEFLFFVEFPEFDSHVSSTTGHSLSIRIEADVVDHACVLSQGLLNVSSLIVPYLYRPIFT